MVPAIIAAGVAASQLLGNQLNSAAERQAKSDARSYLARQARSADSQYAQAMNDINAYYDQRGSLGNASDVAAYRQAMAGYDPNSFVYTPDKTFDQTYTKTREDFLNPYFDKIVGDEVAAVQHSAAGAGLGRGSGAAQAIAKAVAEKENELYREAQQEFKDDRSFEYGKYNDYIQNMQANLDRKRAATDTKLTMQGNLAQSYYDAMDSRQQDLMAARQDRMAANASYANAMAGLY